MKKFLILSAALSAVSGFAEPACATYKKEMLKDPSLIRYYTFEDGYGNEITNHVVLEPGRIAQTGGPIGSLTVNRITPYSCIQIGSTYGDRQSPERNPVWTKGRFPGKTALRSGGVQLGFFRSGITGREFDKGMTISGWFRPEDRAGSCNIFHLSDAWNKGFRFSLVQKRTASGGIFEFRIGDKGKTILYAPSSRPGEWVHFAVTVGNGKARLYVNGAVTAEKDFNGKIIPGFVSDVPDNLPFIETGAATGTKRPEPLLISANPRPDSAVPALRIDWDELAVYNRPLGKEEIAGQFLAGKPSLDKAEQQKKYRALRERETLLDRIRMSIPADSDGYFRIGKPVPAAVELPDALKGRYKVVFELETLYGRKIWTKEQTVAGGSKITVPLDFPECNIYWLDMKLLAPDGSPVKRIPYKYSVAIAPPAPEKLTERNPIAYWADWNERFHFDSPLRRMQYHGNGEHFESVYAHYAKLIPDFRAYLWFYSLHIKPPKEGWEAGREKNRKFFSEAAKRFQGKNIIAFEMTSEPHNIDAKWYVQHLADARKIFNEAGLRQPMIPPGGAPPSIPMISDILKAGGDQYMDGISYHPYTIHPIKDLNWCDSREKLGALMAEYPQKKFILWNTESGINPLPRMKYRPMTAADAHAARMPRRDGAFLGYITKMEESEAASRQVQHALVSLAQGYRIYTICQSPNLNGDAGLRGLAMTALAGQILNNQTAVSRLPLSDLSNVCLLIRQTDGSTIASVFSEKPVRLLFRLKPETEYRVMDMLGNYRGHKTDKEGILAVLSGPHPQYLFNVPTDFAEVVPLKLELPKAISERGEFKGRITVSNPFRTELKGTLTPYPVRGAEIAVSRTNIALAPGKSMEVILSVKAGTLKRQPYTFGVNLNGADGKVIASASQAVQSPGVIRMVPRIRKPMPLDGNPQKWKNIPAMVCDTADSVVHGKPNYAEIWVPQWLGKQDLSFSIKTCWRKGDGIYFLVDVTDDVLLPAPEEKTGLAFRYDCLELFFDSRPADRQGTVFSDGADQVIVIPRNAEKAEKCNFWYARKNREHITVECVGRKTASGWLIEGKITPNVKSTFQIQAGSQFRMDFLIDDTDKDEPKWLRKSAMALDGNFGNATNSNIWGRYELSLDMVK